MKSVYYVYICIYTASESHAWATGYGISVGFLFALEVDDSIDWVDPVYLYDNTS